MKNDNLFNEQKKTTASMKTLFVSLILAISLTAYSQTPEIDLQTKKAEKLANKVAKYSSPHSSSEMDLFKKYSDKYTQELYILNRMRAAYEKATTPITIAPKSNKYGYDYIEVFDIEKVREQLDSICMKIYNRIDWCESNRKKASQLEYDNLKQEYILYTDLTNRHSNTWTVEEVRSLMKGIPFTRWELQPNETGKALEDSIRYANERAEKANLKKLEESSNLIKSYGKLNPGYEWIYSTESVRKTMSYPIEADYKVHPEHLDYRIVEANYYTMLLSSTLELSYVGIWKFDPNILNAVEDLELLKIFETRPYPIKNKDIERLITETLNGEELKKIAELSMNYDTKSLMQSQIPYKSAKKAIELEKNKDALRLATKIFSEDNSVANNYIKQMKTDYENKIKVIDEKRVSPMSFEIILGNGNNYLIEYFMKDYKVSYRLVERVK